MATRTSTRRASKRSSSPKIIHVRVEGEDITVAPTAAHVDANDRLEWHLEGDEGSLLLTFTDGRAIGQTKLRGRPGNAATAQASDRKGVYHYQVAIYTGGELHADVGCPTIIIR